MSQALSARRRVASENHMTGRSELSGIDSCALELTGPERDHLYRSLVRLTPREREVVAAMCARGGNEAVADRLCIALPTLRTHLMRINQKLGTSNKGDLIRFISSRLLDGYRRGVISPGLCKSNNSVERELEAMIE